MFTSPPSPCTLFSHSPASSSPLCCKACGRESGPRPLLRMFRAGPSTSRGEGHAGTGARPAATPTPPPSQSPPSRPRRFTTHPPPFSGIKYKFTPLGLSFPVCNFQQCGWWIGGQICFQNSRQAVQKYILTQNMGLKKICSSKVLHYILHLFL